MFKLNIEDTKGVIRIRISKKNIQHHGNEASMVVDINFMRRQELDLFCG
jgi:hypothetical protein